MKQEFPFSNNLNDNINSNSLEYQPQIFYPVSTTPPPITGRHNEYISVDSTTQQHHIQQIPFDYSTQVSNRARNQSLPTVNNMHYQPQPLQRHTSYAENSQLLFQQQLYYSSSQQFPQNDYVNSHIQIQPTDSSMIGSIANQPSQLSQQLNNQHLQQPQPPLPLPLPTPASASSLTLQQQNQDHVTTTIENNQHQQQPPQLRLQQLQQNFSQPSNPLSRSTLSSPSNSFSQTTPPPQSYLMSTFSSKIVKSTRKHVCEICGKRFTRPSSLQTHSYSHTGEKPFKCDYDGCGRKFSVVSNLRRHKKIHGL